MLRFRFNTVTPPDRQSAGSSLPPKVLLNLGLAKKLGAAL